ncbi:MAG: hypothetical protein NTZ67_04090 [Gammaproteobacteria bacterium]|nr:hypothetical protein [Gammaproteobacteria bacterium]
MIKLKKVSSVIAFIVVGGFLITAAADELTPLQKGIMQQCDAYLNQSGKQPLSDYLSGMAQKNAAQAEANLTYCNQNNFCQYSSNQDCAGKMLAWKFIQKAPSANTSDTQNTLTPSRNPALRSTQIKPITESSAPAPAPAVYKVPPAGLPIATPAAAPVTPEPAQSTSAQAASAPVAAVSAPTPTSAPAQQSINWN